jgi:hypothetical protein
MVKPDAKAYPEEYLQAIFKVCVVQRWRCILIIYAAGTFVAQTAWPVCL